MDYKIEIIPDEKSKEYYWAVLHLHNNTWTNVGHGLCHSIIEACNQALAYYTTYFVDKENIL